jgi:hypothetical protein
VTTVPKDVLIAAHGPSIRHRAQVLASDICGCFFCCATFAPSEITAWTDDEQGVGQTALCPRCAIDSLLGSAAGYPLTSEFLAQMKAHWFGVDQK